MKIAGVSIWIWGFGALILGSATWIALPHIKPIWSEAMKPAPLEVVKESLWVAKTGACEVRGEIHNPRDEGARDVLITYKLWVNRLGANDELLQDHKGNAKARIRYIPPGATVEFTAHGRAQAREYQTPFIDGVEIQEGTAKSPK